LEGKKNHAVSGALPSRTTPIQADFVGSERILGRDVLNQLEILFRGPAAEVVFNP
jgi:hypothetical protein